MQTFERTEKVAWICRNCGYVYYGTNPPDKCPVCQYSQRLFPGAKVKIFKSKSKESKNSSHLFYFFIFFLRYYFAYYLH